MKSIFTTALRKSLGIVATDVRICDDRAVMWARTLDFSSRVSESFSNSFAISHSRTIFIQNIRIWSFWKERSRNEDGSGTIGRNRRCRGPGRSMREKLVLSLEKVNGSRYTTLARMDALSHTVQRCRKLRDRLGVSGTDHENEWDSSVAEIEVANAVRAQLVQRKASPGRRSDRGGGNDCGIQLSFRSFAAKLNTQSRSRWCARVSM